jgi:hypothetical protein
LLGKEVTKLPYLKTLLDRFDGDAGFPLKRASAVLDMIEYSITYPASNTITKKELEEIEVRLKKLLPELKDDSILAHRIEKWWSKRESYQNTAKSVHVDRYDHIGSLQYHENIISIKKTRVALIKRFGGEDLSLKEHGLLGSKYHH